MKRLFNFLGWPKSVLSSSLYFGYRRHPHPLPMMLRNNALSEPSYCNDPICILYSPSNQHVKIEVIFFHDVQRKGHEERHLPKWMSSSIPSECWPQLWLSEEIPHARITSVHYDTPTWSTDTETQLGMYQIAENLRQDILDMYSGEENCPVYLVAHGLGGLIAKNVILSMEAKRSSMQGWVNTSAWQGKYVKRLSCFLENVEGVFYYNTPHLGSRVADYTTSYRHGNSLMDIITTLSTDASQLNEWFREWRIGFGVRTFTMHAARPTKVPLWYGSWTTHVVEQGSARYDTDFFYTFSSDHYDICRPGKKEADVRFQRLVAFILHGQKLPREVGLRPEIEDKLAELRLGEETLPETVEPDAKIENSAEYAARNKLLTNILSSVSKLRQRQGIWLKREDLEKIKEVPEMETRLLESFKTASLAQTTTSRKLELWTVQEKMTAQKNRMKDPTFVERPSTCQR